VLAPFCPDVAVPLRVLLALGADVAVLAAANFIILDKLLPPAEPELLLATVAPELAVVLGDDAAGVFDAAAAYIMHNYS
jgi:predicted phosphoribosyltransferase